MRKGMWSRNKGVVALAAGTLVLTSVALAVPEVWVDDSYTGGEPGFGVTLFNSVNAGLTALDNGGTMHIASGTYPETLTLNNATFAGKDNVTIVGEAPTETEDVRPLITGGAFGATGATSPGSRTGLTIKNIHFTGVGGSAHILYFNDALPNLRIEGCVIDGQNTLNRYGAKCTPQGNLTLVANEFRDIRAWYSWDVFTSGTYGGVNVTNVLYEGNRLVNCQGGINTRTVIGTTCDVVITNNVVARGGTAGFFGGGGFFKVFFATSLLFENNMISNISPLQGWWFDDNGTQTPRDDGNNGLACTLPGGQTVTYGMYESVLSSNVFDCPPRWIMGAAVLMRAPNARAAATPGMTCVIKNNTFRNCRQALAFDVPTVDCAPATPDLDYNDGTAPYLPIITITGNRFIDNEYALMLWNGRLLDNAITMTGNEIYGSGKADAWYTANWRTKAHPGAGAVYVGPYVISWPDDGSDVTMNLTNNWWGHVSGPSGHLADQNLTGDILALSADPLDHAVTGEIFDAVTAAPADGEGDSIIKASPDEDILIKWVPFQTEWPLLDSDGDGLADDFENAGCTDMNEADTDGDGVEDGVEIFLGTDPCTPDSFVDDDGDGLPAFLDPDDNDADFDDDGYKDGYEYLLGLDYTDPSVYPDLGDMDRSGTLDNIDALIAFNLFLGNLPPNEHHMQQADVNRDGRVDNVDAVILFNYFLGNIPYLPYP